MSILVTGGAGYIGSHTALELIKAGHDVVIVDSLVTGYKKAIPEKARFYEGDLRDLDFLDNLFQKEKIDAEEKLKVMEDDLEAKVNDLSTLLDKLEQPEYQMVLTYRYVLNMDWVDIPKVMNYSISSVYRLHRDALYALKIMIVRDS